MRAEIHSSSPDKNCKFKNLTKDSYEIECLGDEKAQITVTVNKTEVLVQCGFRSKKSFLLLSEIKVNANEKFELRLQKCLLPDYFSTLSKTFRHIVKATFSQLRIKIIDELFFDIDSGLIELDLSKNLLTVLSEKTFKSLAHLEILILSSNNFKSLPPQLFQDNYELKHFTMDANLAFVMDDELLSNKKNLISVALSFSGLQDLSEYAFKHSTNLEKIRISGTHLQSVHR